MKSEWSCCCWIWIPSWYCLVGMKLIPYHKIGHFKGGHQKGSRPIPVKHKEESREHREPNPDQLRNSSMEASRRRTWKKESETSGPSTVKVGVALVWWRTAFRDSEMGRRIHLPRISVVCRHGQCPSKSQYCLMYTTTRNSKETNAMTVCFHVPNKLSVFFPAW